MRNPFLSAPSRENDARSKGRIRCESLKCNLGEVVDMSGCGIRVIHHGRRFKVGRQVQVHLAHPSCEMLAKANVVRVERVGFLRQEVGLEFIDLTEKDIQHLATLAQLAVEKRAFDHV